MRINCSLDGKEALDLIGGYKYEERGVVEMKVRDLRFRSFVWIILLFLSVLFSLLLACCSLLYCVSFYVPCSIGRHKRVRRAKACK